MTDEDPAGGDGHTVTVSFSDEEMERLRAAGEDPAAVVREAALDRADLAASIAFTTSGGFREAMGSGTPREEIPPPPVGALVGFETHEVGDGASRLSLQAGPEHANPMGTMHGGVLCDLGDAAMGTAFASTLGEGESFTTLELDCRFLRPVWDDRLTARGEVVHRGGTVGLVEADVENEDGELVAALSSTVLVLSGEQAAGR